MAPEVLHTAGHYSDKYDPMAADIWTAGVILYVFITACLPFDDDNMAQLCKLIKNATYKWPRGEKPPPGAKNLVKKILEPLPEKRPSIADIKKDPWFMYGYKPVSGTELAAEVTPRSASKAKGKTMNAFELLSKMESMNKMGAGMDHTKFLTNKSSEETETLLTNEISSRDFTCTLTPEGTTRCQGHGDSGFPLALTFQAEVVLASVSVVAFELVSGSADDLYTLFVQIAENLKEHVQGKLPQKKAPGEAALMADLARVSDEVKSASP